MTKNCLLVVQLFVVCHCVKVGCDIKDVIGRGSTWGGSKPTTV